MAQDRVLVTLAEVGAGAERLILQVPLKLQLKESLNRNSIFPPRKMNNNQMIVQEVDLEKGPAIPRITTSLLLQVGFAFSL